MATTPKRGRPANTRKNALLPEDAVEAPESVPEKTSKPTLDLTLADLQIIVDAMLGLRNTPENVDVYYKIETYRQELKESMK
jgi:hypothetical protein